MRRKRRKHAASEFAGIASCFFHRPNEGQNHSLPADLNELLPNRRRALTKNTPKSESRFTYGDKKKRPDCIRNFVCRRRRLSRRLVQQRQETNPVVSSRPTSQCTSFARKQRTLTLRLCVCLLLLVSLDCCPSAGDKLLTAGAEPGAGQSSGNSTTCLDPTETLLCNSNDAVSISRPTRLADENEDEDETQTVSVSTKHGVFRGIILFNQLKNWPNRHNSQTDRGKVVGFLGVRYASAPIKRLRFMPPTPYRHAANQLHDSTKFGPICMQRWPIDLDRPSKELVALNWNKNQPSILIDDERPLKVRADSLSSSSNNSSRESEIKIKLELLAKTMSSISFHHLRPLFRRLIAREQSEDCLNLNIYVPFQAIQEQIREAKLPVLVIIHGESFDYGAGSAYDGHKMLLQLHRGAAQMLVVTFNYRLNIFGFLPKLSGASRGNLGLMDQIAALHWIKDNIGSFGGSPSNITLMGTKRGALLVNLLMLSPMAKDLFHRAIMEDGSALSPITTNQVAQHHHNSNFAQYLRILAKLCDCPSAAAVSSSSRILSDSGQQANSLPAEDAKRNAQMLDCLRYKPVDQLIQRIPLELLQLDPNSGDLIIQPRWQAKVRPLLPTNAGMQIKSSEHLAQIISQLTSQEVAQNQHLAAATSSDLFEAIYGHTNLASSGGSTVRPLFGPLIDGSIVTDEDFASNMLKEDSNLIQRDLLIGLTHPVLFADESSARNGTSAQVMPLLSADNYLAERILASQELQGLSNEQAISLVNAFVRSFYRYHNQEIANSILNHYLSLANVWHQQVSLTSTPTKQLTDSHRSSNSNNMIISNDDDKDAKDDEPAAMKLQRRRQEFLLSSISRLFRDSLTDVPLFKLALIHSIKQMEPLLNAFIDKLFDQWKAAGESRRHLAEEQDNFPPATGSDLAVERKSLLESFTASVRHHLDGGQPNNFEWRQLSAGPQMNVQIRSTFLYQFHAGSSGQSTEAAIERILTREKATEQENVWKLISPILRDLAARIKSLPPVQRGSLECAYYPSDGHDDTMNGDSNNIAARLEDWLCSRQVGKILTGFIVAGDVNQADDSDLPLDSIDVNENLANVESECFTLQTPKDHHLVQPAISNDSRSIHASNNNKGLLSAECRKQLANIALTVLTNELKRQLDESKSQSSRWANFDIFSQQVATLTGDSQQTPWRMNRISEFTNEPTSLVSKASFWSNFIPALNCNKTQPITPSALLDGFSNSSLLNLGLQFTCQHGSRTAQDYLESIVSVAGQRLKARKSQWRLSNTKQTSTTQNHHSLRMANMSQSNSVDEISLGDSSFRNDENQTSHLVGATNFQLSPNESELNKSRAANLRANKVTGLVLILCAVIVCVTLISGIYLATKRRRRRLQSGKQISHTQEQQRKAEVNGRLETQQSPSPGMNFQPAGQLDQHSTEMIAACLDGDNSHATSGADWDANKPDLNSASRFKDEQQFQYDPNNSFSVATAASQCRSHSAMSLAPQLQLANDNNSFVHVDPFNLATDQPFGPYGVEGFGLQEPIVMPILSSNQEFRCQTLDARRNNYHHLANCDNQSSTETQNGRSSQSSALATATTTTTTTKKRVKINDPQSIMKRVNQPNGRARQYSDVNYGHANQQQPAYHNHNKPRVQLCPIHSRSQSSQYLTGGYILDGGTSEYLTVNNPEIWASDRVDATNTLGGYQNNCDHFPSS